jgi:hypothetical protein
MELTQTLVKRTLEYDSKLGPELYKCVHNEYYKNEITSLSSLKSSISYIKP